MSIRSRIRRRLRKDASADPVSAAPGASVPLAHMRDEAPSGGYRLISEYLLPESRLRRRETTFNAYVSVVGSRTIEVDFSLPLGDGKGETCYVPVAYFPKNEVAPSLEAKDATGRVLALPTKRENMALTQIAIEKLVADGALTLIDPERSKELIGEVIANEPLPARVSRMLLQSHEPGAQSLFQALDLLEDHFLLWVPVCGDSESQHHLTICRTEPHPPFPLFRRRRQPVIVPYETALGEVQIRVREATGRPTFDVFAALDRLLNAFALRPLEVGARESEAGRFASCHLRFHAPDGFLVRHLRVGVTDGSLPRPEHGNRIPELDGDDPDVVIQGIDQDVGHVHLSRRVNPRQLYVNVSLGLREGTTTLWMLATVLTAVLLWLVHHHPRYGPPRFQNKQIVAAALLVGPAVASAWSLRGEGGELLRTSLSGARVLLLASAALSVATALALADVLPFGLNRYDAISIYAAVSYFIATAMTTAWILSGRPTWRLLRGALRRPNLNLVAIAFLGLVALLVGLHDGPRLRPDGLLLLAAGLGLAVISANTVAEPLGGSRAFYRLLASVGAIPVIFAAGFFLGFYTNRFDADLLRMLCMGVGVALILLSITGFLLSESGEMKEERS